MFIFGKNTCFETIKKQSEIEEIFISQTNIELQNEVKRLLKSRKVKITLMNNNLMNKTFNGNHQGIALKVMEYDYVLLDDLIKKTNQKQNVAFAILDSLEDPHNLGAILRTADATQMDGIIIPKNRSVGLNSTVAKVSTGAIEHVDVCQETNLVSAINTLKKHGFWIIGLEADGAIDYKKQDYSGKIAVVIGSEGKGISRLVKENCDFFVKIPMLGHVNSLNASVSASLIFYEIIRNR